MNTEGESREAWDFFISHASEDKDSIARPLAEALQNLGFAVWFDEYQLHVGDSIRRRIDLGLSHCRNAVVILSRHFFDKEWALKELDALIARESAGRKIVLPVWHGISAGELRNLSPILADRFAVRTEEGLQKVVESVLRARGYCLVDKALVGSIEDVRASVTKKIHDPDSVESTARSLLPWPASKECVLTLLQWERKIDTLGKRMLPAEVGSFRVCANNRRFAYIGAERDKVFWVVDGQRGAEFDQYANFSLCFSPNSQHVAAGFYLGPRCYLCLDGQLTGSFDGLGGISFSPDSAHVAFVERRGDRLVVHWEDRESRAYEEIAAAGLVFSSDSRHLLFVGRRNGKSHLVLDNIEIAHHQRINQFAFSPDSHKIAYIAEDFDGWFLCEDEDQTRIYSYDDTISIVYDDCNEWFYWETPRSKLGQIITVCGASTDRFAGSHHRFVSLPGCYIVHKKSGRWADVIPLHGQLAIVSDGNVGPFHDALTQSPPVFNDAGTHLAYPAEDNDQWSIYVDGVPSGLSYDIIVHGSMLRFEDETTLTIVCRRENDILATKICVVDEEEQGTGTTGVRKKPED